LGHESTNTSRSSTQVPLGALSISIVITLRWKKLPRANSAAGSFDPFKRQECDRRSQEIYALHQQGVTVRELAEQFGLSQQRVGGICTAERKHEQGHLPPQKNGQMIEECSFTQPIAAILFHCYNYFQHSLKGFFPVKTGASDQAAIKALQSCLEKIPFLQVESIQQADLPGEPDLRVTVCVQERSIQFLVKISNNGQPRWARQATYELQQWLTNLPNAYGIFVAPYISSAAAAICQAAGIGYLDLAGNCYLSFETIFIQNTGVPNPFSEQRRLRSLYMPKSERILRVLLSQPKRAWKTADLAAEAGVSFGLVANVKKLLADREWLGTNTDGMYLARPGELLDDWVKAYNYRRSQMHEFYSLSEIPAVEAGLAETCERLGVQYALTSFSAAMRLAPMVRYNRVMAYVQGDLSAVAAEARFKPVDSGANVILLAPYDDGVFYGAAPVGGIMTASPVQVYLDVIGSRARGQEAADAIRQKLEATW